MSAEVRQKINNFIEELNIPISLQKTDCNNYQYLKTDVEIWKPIQGYEGLYEVSNLGRVKCLCNYHTKIEKILKGSHQHGYDRVGLTIYNISTTYKTHRLVAEAFIPNLKNYPEINHKDYNTLNNYVGNLEWCSKSYNTWYSKERNIHGSKLNKEQVSQIFKLFFIENKTFSELSDKFGVIKKTISAIVHKKIWKEVTQDLDCYDISKLKQHTIDLRGEKNSCNKLSENQVLEIKKLHRDEKIGYKTLAKKYNVHWDTIRKIVKGKLWPHLKDK